MVAVFASFVPARRLLGQAHRVRPGRRRARRRLPGPDDAGAGRAGAARRAGVVAARRGSTGGCPPLDVEGEGLVGPPRARGLGRRARPGRRPRSRASGSTTPRPGAAASTASTSWSAPGELVVLTAEDHRPPRRAGRGGRAAAPHAAARWWSSDRMVPAEAAAVRARVGHRRRAPATSRAGTRPGAARRRPPDRGRRAATSPGSRRPAPPSSRWPSSPPEPARRLGTARTRWTTARVGPPRPNPRHRPRGGSPMTPLVPARRGCAPTASLVGVLLLPGAHRLPRRLVARRPGRADHPGARRRGQPRRARAGEGRAAVAAGRLLAAGLTSPAPSPRRHLRLDADRPPRTPAAAWPTAAYYAVHHHPAGLLPHVSDTLTGKDAAPGHDRRHQHRRDLRPRGEVSDQVARVVGRPARRAGHHDLPRPGLPRTGDLAGRLGDAADGAQRLATGTERLGARCRRARGAGCGRLANGAGPARRRSRPPRRRRRHASPDGTGEARRRRRPARRRTRDAGATHRPAAGADRPVGRRGSRALRRGRSLHPAAAGLVRRLRRPADRRTGGPPVPGHRAGRGRRTTATPRGSPRARGSWPTAPAGWRTACPS